MKVNSERICEDFGRITSENVDHGGGGQLTVHLGRIREDLESAKIVEPCGGGGL